MNSGLLNGCVHPGYAEAGCNVLKKLSNKAPLIEEKKLTKTIFSLCQIYPFPCLGITTML
jgi:hypothetical protein